MKKLKGHFPTLDFLGRLSWRLVWPKDGSSKNLHFGRSKVGGCVHHNRKPGTKMEIRAPG